MLTNLVTDFSNAVRVAGFEAPVAIELGLNAAAAFKIEIGHVLKYAKMAQFKHNETMWDGILVVAPKNFSWYW